MTFLANLLLFTVDEEEFAANTPDKAIESQNNEHQNNNSTFCPSG